MKTSLVTVASLLAFSIHTTYSSSLPTTQPASPSSTSSSSSTLSTSSTSSKPSTVSSSSTTASTVTESTPLKSSTVPLLESNTITGEVNKTSEKSSSSISNEIEAINSLEIVKRKEKELKKDEGGKKKEVRDIGSKRPFYNIAHMVNSIKEVNYYLAKGANAIEADVAFAPNGTALYTFHGYPCDCFRHCTEREEISKYMEYIREITRPESPYYKKGLSLIFFDCKISGLPPSSKATAGADMADKVADIIYSVNKPSASDSKIKVLMSIGHIFDSDFILGFQARLEARNLADKLTKNIGWDVGLNDPINSIVSMWKRIEVIDNIWQGDGRSNCISPFYNLGRLTQAVDRRDERNDMIENPFIDKVYHWTIDLTHNLRASVRAGVDGIITNHPERLINILREPEFYSRVRLADQEDDPWSRVPLSREDGPYILAASGPEPVSVRWVSGFNDMVTSFAKYLRDFVYLRVPSYQNISIR